jgi:hypothetical protein
MPPTVAGVVDLVGVALVELIESGVAVAEATGAEVVAAKTMGAGVLVTASAVPVIVEPTKAIPSAAKIAVDPIIASRLTTRGTPLPPLRSSLTAGFCAKAPTSANHSGFPIIRMLRL